MMQISTLLYVVLITPSLFLVFSFVDLNSRSISHQHICQPINNNSEMLSTWLLTQ